MAGTNPADTNIDGLLSSSPDTAPIVSAPAEIAAVADGNSAIIDRAALLVNATDVDGDSLNVVVDTSTLPDGVTYNHVDGSTVDVTTTSYYGFTQTITIPAVDTLALDTSSAQFTSLAAGETMDVVVSYDVTDGTLATQAEAVFHVTGVNDAPVVSSALAVDAIEGGEVATLDALASASDPDHGSVLTVVAPPPPPGETENFVNAAGVVEGAAPPPPPPMPFDASALPAGISFDAVSNSFSIDPTHPAFDALSAGEVATVTVNYGVSDGIAVTAASATFTITGTNDAPVVTGPGMFSVQEDFGVASVAPTSGELEVEAPEVEVPEVELHDLAEKDSSGSIVIPNSINLLVNASDPDHDANLSVVDLPAELPQGISYLHVDPVVTTAGYYGATTTTPGVDALVIDPTNAAFQSLAEGETITIIVDYAVSDGFVSTPAQAIFTITGTNDAPVIDGQVMAIGNEDGTLVSANALASASDVDHGAVLSITATPAVAAPDDYWARGAGEVDDHGVDSVDGTPIHVSFDISALPSFITFDETTNTLTLDPSDVSFQHLSSGETMTVTVNYGVTDGIAPAASFASTTFTVVGTNDAPIVSGPATLTVNEDQGASATGVATDDSG
ncbi:MAG: VCBS domain-containing protein, partial [Fimbriimonadaceae bacterium]|nr:VCBS domain-containing protein [Fimbriimonadaceae bacterium]